MDFACPSLEEAARAFSKSSHGGLWRAYDGRIPDVGCSQAFIKSYTRSKLGAAPIGRNVGQISSLSGYNASSMLLAWPHGRRRLFHANMGTNSPVGCAWWRQSIFEGRFPAGARCKSDGWLGEWGACHPA